MDKKVAVVIGGTGQIGSSIVEFMYQRHYNVICISRTVPQKKLNGIDYLSGDMSISSEVDRVVDIISDKYSAIDALINPIGGNIHSSTENITNDDWDQVISMNLTSVFFICRGFSKVLKTDNEGSSIINFSSTAAIKPFLHSPHYISAKAGVIELTKYFAKLYAPKIRINCICPGVVYTSNHRPENYPLYNSVINELPLHKMTSLQEINNSVWFLLNTETMTGHSLIIDSGMTL